MKKVTIILLLYLANASFADEAYSIALTLPLVLFVAHTVYNIKNPLIVEDDALWFVVFLYFCIHPMQAIINSGVKANANSIPFSYRDYEVYYAFAIVYLFFAAFSLAKFTPASKPSSVVFTFSAPSYETTLFLIVASCFPIFVIAYGPSNLLAPRFLQSFTDTSSFAVFPLSAMSVATLLHASLLRAKMARNRLHAITVAYFITECILLLVAKNPLNSARFHLLIIWGPIFLTLIRGRLGGVAFYVLALVGILVIFPILSYSTRFGLRGDEFRTVAAVKLDPFELQSVDVFKILVHAVQFMESSSLYYGEKITAIILWFAPRALWPEKPIVGGLDVGHDLLDRGLTGTDNVSFFVGGDFYMDFGFGGVLLGGFLVGLIYYKMTSRLVLVGSQPLTRYIWVCALPILIRGPLGATIGLFSCELLILAVLTRVLGTRQTLSVRPDAVMTRLAENSAGMAQPRRPWLAPGWRPDTLSGTRATRRIV